MNRIASKIKQSIGLVLVIFLVFSQTPLQAAEIEEPIYTQDSIELLDSFNLAQTQFERFEKAKRDPARALALSALYFGLGQFYIGDVQRGTWVTLVGSLILAGSFAGWAILGDEKNPRPEEATSLGNLLIIGVLGGYYIWQIKDSFDSAEAFNRKLEKKYFLSTLENIKVSVGHQSLHLSYRIPL